MRLYRRWLSRPSPRKRNAKKQSVVWGGLIKKKRREKKKRKEKKKKKEKKRGKKQRRKGKIYHLNVEFQRIARRDKKAFLSYQCKEIEENNRMGKTRDLFNKLRDTKGTFHAKTGTIKDRNGMDLTEAEDIKRWQEHRRAIPKRSSRPR